jgi:hypothetical protein
MSSYGGGYSSRGGGGYSGGYDRNGGGYSGGYSYVLTTKNGFIPLSHPVFACFRQRSLHAFATCDFLVNNC